MTRLLIFTDIHGNADALAHLLHYVDITPTLHADAWRCLGDVVGCYHDPVRAWTLAYEKDPALRLGNHDLYLKHSLIEGELGVGLGESETVAWTIFRHKEMLKREAANNPEFQKALDARLQADDALEPRIEVIGDFTLIYVHGQPFAEHHHDYANQYLWATAREASYRALARSLAVARHYRQTKHTLVFVGHTHQPMIVQDVGGQPVFRGGRWTTEVFDRPIDLNTDPLYAGGSTLIVNGGSVGQPRIGADMKPWRIQALHLDTETATLRFLLLTPGLDVWNTVSRKLARWQLFDDDTNGFDILRLKQFYTLKARYAEPERRAQYLEKAALDPDAMQHEWGLQVWQLADALADGFTFEIQGIYRYTADGFSPD